MILRRRDLLLGVAGATLIRGRPAHASEDSLPTIYLIGDSTVNNHAKGQLGWGDPFVDLFDPARVHVFNRARGGRSSRTFWEEGLWTPVRDALKPGDFVLMQFGHNDGGPLDRKPYRATLHGTGEETGTFADPVTGKDHVAHTYGWYMDQYVRDTKAKGATPIVLSPVPRNIWSKDNKTVVRASGDYGKWAEEIARREGVPFIELNDIIAKKYEAEGQPKVASTYFGATDHTHTTPVGARLNAACVAEGIRGLKDGKLAGHLKASP